MTETPCCRSFVVLAFGWSEVFLTSQPRCGWLLHDHLRQCLRRLGQMQTPKMWHAIIMCCSHTHGMQGSQHSQPALRTTLIRSEKVQHPQPSEVGGLALCCHVVSVEQPYLSRIFSFLNALFSVLIRIPCLQALSVSVSREHSGIALALRKKKKKEIACAVAPM